MARIGYVLTFLFCTCILITGCRSASSEFAFTKNSQNQAERQVMTPYLTSQISPHNFDDTVDRLRAGIEKRPLKLFAEVDHAQGAAGAGLSLAPSTLFIFGNPKGGTPLMIRNSQLGIALPLKMHVYKSGSEIIVSYQDMEALTESYGLDATLQPIPNIVALLDGLAGEAVHR